MAAGGTGAVFFLGTRAHYQVLQQPESRFDLENGNASTETIYQNPSVQEVWPKGQADADGTSSYITDRGNWSYEKEVAAVNDEKEKAEVSTNTKKRSKRRVSETTLCEKDNDMKPAALNSLGDNTTPKPKNRRRIPLVTFLQSLGRRKRRLDSEHVHYLQHIESALMSCTYRESCRCLECQSRYFECDEDSDYDDYNSDDSDYTPHYVAQVEEPDEPSYGDDEVFVESVPGDNTSTDLLLDKEKMSISSDEPEESEEERNLNLEVAAGTPVLLNYLLTHPITCAIQ